MTDLLIWGGPVTANNLRGIAWAPGSEPTVVVFNTGPGGGIGSSSFAELAASMRDGSGRILPNLLASRGLSRASFGKVGIGGFSAFHGLASALLASDGDQIDAAFLLDACFSAVPESSWPKAGYVSFGADAARGDKLMVYTASAGGGPSGPYPSSTGTECMMANLAGAAQAAGVALERFAPPVPMPPGDGWRAGQLYGFDYGPQYNSGFTHNDLINRWGVATMEAFAVPFYAGTLSPGGSPWWKKALYAAGGLAVVAGAIAGGVALADHMDRRR